MRFLENRILAKKTGPGRPGNIRDSWDLDKALFLVYIYYQIEKIWKTGRFGSKPETGQILSGKFFSKKISKFDIKYDSMIVYGNSRSYISNIRFGLTESEQQQQLSSFIDLCKFKFARSKIVTFMFKSRYTFQRFSDTFYLWATKRLNAAWRFLCNTTNIKQEK